MPRQTFYALIHREEDLYVAFCPEANTASQGATPEEAVANLREATELYLEDFTAFPRKETVFLTTFEIDCPDK
jgi:predicted RNase H-like HicB family nuclease